MRIRKIPKVSLEVNKSPSPQLFLHTSDLVWSLYLPKQQRRLKEVIHGRFDQGKPSQQKTTQFKLILTLFQK